LYWFVMTNVAAARLNTAAPRAAPREGRGHSKGDEPQGAEKRVYFMRYNSHLQWICCEKSSKKTSVLL